MLLPVQSCSFPVHGHMLRTVKSIMLNTSLYNPNVWDKPDLECFVALNPSINEGETC